MVINMDLVLSFLLDVIVNPGCRSSDDQRVESSM